MGFGRVTYEAGETIPLRLLSSETFSTGVLYLVYGPDDAPPEGGYEEAKATLPQAEK